MKYRHPFLLLFLFLLGLPAWSKPSQEELTTLIKSFDSYVESSRKAWNVPGLSVALVVDGKEIWSKGYGVRHIGKPEPVTADTIFQIGSISKSFTSTLVALQVDQGKLSWTDRVIDRFPEFRMQDPWVTREFTVQDTMAQRSGQPGGVTDALSFLGYGRDDILRAMRYVAPVSSFRNEFAYVNNMWLVTAKVVELASGLTWEQAIEQDIFAPLGMTSSSLTKTALLSAPNHATPHQWGGDKAVPLPNDWPFLDWVYVYGPAGGVNSNVHDMAKYLGMQMGSTKLVSPASLKKLHFPMTPVALLESTQSKSFADVAPLAYCLGWLRQDRQPHSLIWHNGGTSGFRTVAGFVPESKIGIVVLSNTSDSNLSEALMMRFYDMYYGLPEYDYSAAWLDTWKASQPVAEVRPKSARQPAPMASYLGTYRHQVYGDAKVERVGSNLKVTVGDRMILNLLPWDADIFRFRDPINFNSPLGTASFESSSNDAFHALRLNVFADIDAGCFYRVPESRE